MTLEKGWRKTASVAVFRGPWTGSCRGCKPYVPFSVLELSGRNEKRIKGPGFTWRKQFSSLCFIHLYSKQTLKSVLGWGPWTCRDSCTWLHLSSFAWGKYPKPAWESSMAMQKRSAVWSRKKRRAIFLCLYHSNLSLRPRPWRSLKDDGFDLRPSKNRTNSSYDKGQRYFSALVFRGRQRTWEGKHCRGDLPGKACPAGSAVLKQVTHSCTDR